MHPVDCLHTLDFDDHKIFDHQINPIAQIDLLAIVNNRKLNLPCYLQSLLTKFMGQTGFVGAFQQARPQPGVYFNGGGYYLARDLVDAR